LPTVGYDFNDAGDFADFVVLENGPYVFSFKEADASQKSSAGNKKVIISLVVEAASPANRHFVGGMIRQHWPTSGGASGRLRDFFRALGIKLSKDKGQLKLEKYYGDEIGAIVSKKAGDRTDEDGNTMWFNELSRMMPGDQMRDILAAQAEEEDEEEEELDEEDEEEEDDDVEEDEDDEEEEEEEDAEEDEEEEDDDEDDEEFLTIEEMRELPIKELRELAKENGISIKPPKGKTKLDRRVLVKRLEKLWEEEEEDEDDGEEDPF
jgi:hypothetical protein